MKLLSNFNIKNSKILIRVDFNVPIKNGKITDETRIFNVLPTINHLLEKNNALVLISHLGRPKKKSKKHSLILVYNALKKALDKPVFFSRQIIGEEVEKKKEVLNLGEVLLIENIRFHKDEQFDKTHNDRSKNFFFTKQIAQKMDFFINEAFACSHRKSSSMTLLPMCFPNKKLAGFLLEKEIQNLTKVKGNSQKPFTAIIGGSKISTKIKLIQKLVLICDNIILGGAMAHTFIVYLEGKIGSSLFEPDQLLEVEKILQQADKNNCKIHLPSDCVTTKKISNNSPLYIREINNIPNKEMSVDIGPDSISFFNKIILRSKTILWNGPMGIFEFPAFSNGTKKIANSIHNATKLGSFSVIGGGDSISAINSFNMNFHFSYLSTGGGAMLEFFEKEKLPGIVALED